MKLLEHVPESDRKLWIGKEAGGSAEAHSGGKGPWVEGFAVWGTIFFFLNLLSINGENV